MIDCTKTSPGLNCIADSTAATNNACTSGNMCPGLSQLVKPANSGGYTAWQQQSIALNSAYGLAGATAQACAYDYSTSSKLQLTTLEVK